MEQKKLRVLALVGMLAAVGYVLQLFEFPLLPAVAFLKFDFGDVAVVVSGSMFGPGAAVLTAVVKGLLWVLIGRGGNGLVGAGMNTIAVIVFALPLVLVARSQRLWIKVAAGGMGVLAMTAVMVGLNLVVDPLYFKYSLEQVNAIMPSIIFFNVLRGLLNGTASVLVLVTLQRTGMLRTAR